MAIIKKRAISGFPKNVGSPPNSRIRRETGPKRTSNMDFPIIQDTATGLNIKGRRKTTRKNLRARIWAFSRSAKANAITYSALTAST